MSQKAIKDLEGRSCIYKEKELIHLVTVVEALIDKWGASFTLKVAEASGFVRGRTTEFTVSGAWDILAVSDKSVSAAWVGWTLVTRQDLVERIKNFARETSDVAELMRFVNELAFGMKLR